MRILPQWEPSRRNPSIDFLRGISIGCVFLAHSVLLGPFSESLIISSKFMGQVGVNGAYGVSMFFVISGFIITSTSLKRYGNPRSVRIRQFYLFRMSRVLPPLLLLVALNLFCRQLGAGGFALTPEIPVGKLMAYLFSFRFNLLYLQGGYNLAAWGVLWSLAIEEVFYLAFPILCRVLRSERLLCAVLLFAFIYGPFYRFKGGWSSLYLYTGCFDQLALGCLTAIAARRWTADARHPWIPGSLRFGGLALAAVAYFWVDIHQNVVMGPTLVGIGAALFLLGSSPSAEGTPAPGGNGWFGRWVCICGLLSYELYLFHPAFFLLAKPLLARIAGRTGGILPFDAGLASVVAALVVAAGWLSAGFSEPVLHYLRNVFAPAARRSVGPVFRARTSQR